jgi:hypothetical protein
MLAAENGGPAYKSVSVIMVTWVIKREFVRLRDQLSSMSRKKLHATKE